jgi:hypothetical protein
MKNSWNKTKMKMHLTKTFGTAKAVLRRKFIAISNYIKKRERESSNK